MADGQVSPIFYTNVSRDGSGAYPSNYSSNPRSYAGNNNLSLNQPYTPRISARNSLESHPDSGRHPYRSVPGSTLKRDLPPLPHEYRHEPQRVRPHSDFITHDIRALQYSQGDQDVYGQRNPYAHYMSSSFNSSYYSPSSSSSRFASVPPHGIHPDTRSNRRSPAELRQGHHSMADDDSDVEYETITAEEASRIPQDDFYAKLPKAFRRTTSDGKLKKQMMAPTGPGGGLREPRPNALEMYRLSSGNGGGFTPGGFQGFLPRKLKRR